MKDNELNGLQDVESWDYERLEARDPVKNQRSVLSVAFNSADFAQVVKCAQQLGMRTSEFVRDAAIARSMSEAALSHPSAYTFSYPNGIEILFTRPQVTRVDHIINANPVPESAKYLEPVTT